MESVGRVVEGSPSRLVGWFEVVSGAGDTWVVIPSVFSLPGGSPSGPVAWLRPQRQEEGEEEEA